MKAQRGGKALGLQGCLVALALSGMLVIAGCGGGGGSGSSSSASSTPCTVGGYAGNLGEGTDTAIFGSTTYTEGQDGDTNGVPPAGGGSVAMCDPIMESGVGGANIEAIVYFNYDGGSHDRGLHVMVPRTTPGTNDEGDVGFLIQYTPGSGPEYCVVNGSVPDAGVASATIDTIETEPGVISGSATVTNWDTGSTGAGLCTEPLEFSFVIAQTLSP